MSAVKVAGSASATANFTVTPPNGTSTDRTLTLPDRTCTLASLGPSFSAQRAIAATGLPSATWSLIACDNELYDSDGYFDPTSITQWAFKPLVAGWYQINYSAYVTQSTSAVVAAGLAKNGTLIAQSATSVGGGQVSAASKMVLFNGTTDYVQLYAYGGGTSPVIQPGNGTFIEGFFIRP